jgi:hypothetical protein
VLAGIDILEDMDFSRNENGILELIRDLRSNS